MPFEGLRRRRQPMLISLALIAVAAAALLQLVAGPSFQALLMRRGPAAMGPAPSSSSRASEPERLEFERPKIEDAHCGGGSRRQSRSRARVGYGDGPGALVFGWPAKGGVYVHTASAVEVEFLGYERFEAVPRPSPADPGAAAEEEEAHCNRMRQLGAVWWKSEDAWLMDQISPEVTRCPKPFLATGWPPDGAGGEGGVWVLSTTDHVAAEKGAGMLFNAYSMAERCAVIERLGGTFYADPRDCPDLDLAGEEEPGGKGGTGSGEGGGGDASAGDGRG